MKLVFFILFPLLLFSQKKVTTVYLVRHAEKEILQSDNKNPNLSQEGILRSEKLAQLLKNKKINQIYSTDFLRTLQTAQPLSTLINKKPIIYNPKNLETLANTILQNNKGEKVLIIGHSNTLIPLIKAFGGNINLEEIKENEYFYLFKLKVCENKTRVNIKKF